MIYKKSGEWINKSVQDIFTNASNVDYFAETNKSKYRKSKSIT